MRGTLILALAAVLAATGCERTPESRAPNTANPATPPASTAMPPATSSAGAAGTATSAAKDATTFVDKAGRAGAFEIEASKLAQASATSSDLKTFAGRMVADHSRAAEELRQAAGGLSVPVEPSPEQRAKLDALKAKSGAEFDRSYANEVGVSAHEEAVALFDDYARNGTDASLKAYAGKTLPALREHLELAKQMAAAVVASK